MKKLLNFLRSNKSDSSSLVRKKQIGMLILGIVIIFGGVAFLQVGVKKVTSSKVKVHKKKKTVIGDFIDDRDVWASRLESQVFQMGEIAKNFKKQNELQEKRLKNIENVLIHQEKNKGKGFQKGTKEKAASNSATKRVNSLGFNTSSISPPISGSSPVVKNTFLNGGNSVSSGRSNAPFKKILHFSAGDQTSFHNVRDYVVAGTYSKAVLTSGVVVSTSVSTQGNPQPIVMHLGDHGNLPRGWKSRLKDAVIIGSCYGDLSSERAMCRIHSLSFVEPSGNTVEKQVEGWIIGEDGAPGLRGKVVDRAGKVVRESFIAGMLSGMSNFVKSSTQSSVFPVSPFGQTNALKDNDVLKSGAAQGISGALEKLAEFSIKRAQAMSPVLVVNPGRVVDIVFKKGFNLSPTISNQLRSVNPSLNSKKGN